MKGINATYGGGVGKRVLIISDRMGSGDDELGAVLIKSFLHYLADAPEAPSDILLANAGVKLACEGAEDEVLSALRALVGRGTHVRACTTCLNHFGLLDKLAIGDAGTMPVTVELLMADDGVITIA